MRSFAGNLILLLGLNFLVKPFYILGIEAEVQNRVGAEIYGSYFALISFSFLLNIVLDMGITNFNTRNIARDREAIVQHFGGLVGIRGLLLVVYLILILACGFFIGYDSQQMYILLILAFNQGLAAMVLFLRSNLTGLHLFRQDSVISVLDRVILILIMAALLWGGFTGGEFDIMWFVYGQTAAYLMTVLTAFVLVGKRVPRLRLSLSMSHMKEILKKSFPYALLFFLMMIYYKSDSVMLERMLDDDAREAGTYAMGYRFFEAANMIAYLFAIILLPVFSRMIKKNENVGPLTAMVFRLLISGAVILALACWNWRVEIMNWRYVENALEASGSFGILMFSFLGIALTYIFGTLLTAHGSMKALNAVAASAVILNIVLNLVLIPELQAYGAALASLITQGLAAIAQVILVIMIFEFQLNRRLILRSTIFCAGIIGLLWLPETSSWVINLLLYGTLSGALAVLTGMVGLYSLREFLSLKQKNGA